MPSRPVIPPPGSQVPVAGVDDRAGGLRSWPADTGWRPLPGTARLLFLLDTGLVLALAGLAAGGLAGLLASTVLDAPSTLVAVMQGAAAGLVVFGGWGSWLAARQYRRTFWRLDRQGLAVRRGHLWWRENRVPATRVQHLDIQRGPLQRRRGLATLVVHTAGTANSSVTVPHLDAADAEYLRDRLSRQIEDDDDAG
ncbi:PH domain-containing protein [Lysobacter sp. GX 14042]|uniref:PH domain-containing protein n=1 Tax=Lysobacter sp. GX 14042 TaxID=2907155 RepID=UPI001F2EF943|nr:PH domain-containing protein [Lysobacter sp. GX 14042]MCE7032090.1 PH domain-containing protein [Lysobacter sp. GX 14042]